MKNRINDSAALLINSVFIKSTFLCDRKIFTDHERRETLSGRKKNRKENTAFGKAPTPSWAIFASLTKI